MPRGVVSKGLMGLMLSEGLMGLVVSGALMVSEGLMVSKGLMAVAHMDFAREIWLRE